LPWSATYLPRVSRFASILLLAALALPYARTPICSSAGHAHDGHHPANASLAAQDTHGGPGADCHALMACDTSIQGMTPLGAGAQEVDRGLTDGSHRPTSGYEAPTRAPAPPPPQIV